MKKDAGFTLIEIIVTLVLLGIMAAIAGMMIAQGAQGYVMARANNELSQKAQLALDRMILEFEDISDISSVQKDDPGSICYTLRYYDVNTDSTTDVVNRCISRAGSQINIDGSALIDNVNAFQLDFYDITDDLNGSGTWALGDPVSNLASIRIVLTLNRTDVTGGTYTYSTLYNVRRNGIIGRYDEPLNWNRE